MLVARFALARRCPFAIVKLWREQRRARVVAYIGVTNGGCYCGWDRRGGECWKLRASTNRRELPGESHGHTSL